MIALIINTFISYFFAKEIINLVCIYIVIFSIKLRIDLYVRLLVISRGGTSDDDILLCI